MVVFRLNNDVRQGGYGEATVVVVTPEEGQPNVKAGDTILVRSAIDPALSPPVHGQKNRTGQATYSDPDLTWTIRELGN